MNPAITVATTGDRGHVVATLVAAFTRDPAVRFMFPDDATYPRLASVFFGQLFDQRVPLGTVWTIGSGASNALWDPPTRRPATAPPRPAAPAIPAEAPSPDALPPEALARMRAYDEAVHAALPTTPHWYLGVLGTHPDHAGHGYGRAVMRAGLERAAAEHLPAYLETSNPRNVVVYEKAGWRVVNVIAVPLPTWIMTQ